MSTTLSADDLETRILKLALAAPQGSKLRHELAIAAAHVTTRNPLDSPVDARPVLDLWRELRALEDADADSISYYAMSRLNAARRILLNQNAATEPGN